MGQDGPLLIGMALTGIVGFPILLYYALRFTTATNAALINGTGPLVTAALAAVLLHERLRPAQLAGAALSLSGVALVIGVGVGGFAGGLNRGDAIMLLDAAIWALYSIMGRVVMRGRSNLSATAFATWFALPPLLVAAAFEWRTAPPDLTPAGVLGVLYIGVFAAFVAVILWNEGVRRTGPTGAMAFYNMLPVFGALLGALVPGRAPGAPASGRRRPRRAWRIDQRPMEDFSLTETRARRFAALALNLHRPRVSLPPGAHHQWPSRRPPAP